MTKDEEETKEKGGGVMAEVTDFNVVKRQIIAAYLKIYGNDNSDDIWSLGNVLDLFRYFYRTYKAKFKRDHPHITTDTIRGIIQDIPEACDEETGMSVEFCYDDYPPMIRKYFKSDFGEGCDYTIQHFMSGKIRYIKYYETQYESY